MPNDGDAKPKSDGGASTGDDAKPATAPATVPDKAAPAQAATGAGVPPPPQAPIQADGKTPGNKAAGLGPVAVRFFKYAVLLCVVAGTLKVTFDCYSYFIARRSIDAELQAKSMSSLEGLVVARQRNRDAVVALFETRCVERDIIALYRLFDGTRSLLDKASVDAFDAKTAAIRNLRKHGNNVLKPEKLNELTGTDFSLEAVEPELSKPANLVDGVEAADARLAILKKKWEEDKVAYEKVAAKHNALMREIAAVKDLQLSVASVRALEARFSRLKAQTDAERQREEALAEVLARYDTWTQALVPQGSIEQAVEAALNASKSEQDGPQQALRCDDVGVYRKAVDLLRVEEESWAKAGLLTHLTEPATLYRRMLLRYFQQAPAAQTLFVTLLIGALGALTLNILRLSKVGWWYHHHDPDWGEIVIGPFLGALAAFGIYLVGSAGLLLTSDVRNGPSSLSAAFIGLLGFVSGLLYDEAFGRVRRVGSQIFSGDKPDDLAVARPEDIALARALQGAGATLIASLVAKRQLGLRLLAETEFTFVVPSDIALGAVTLQWWTDMNDARKPTFDDWYRHHHATRKLVASDAAATPPPALVMDDGKAFPIAPSGASLKIGTAEVVKPDLMWNNGVIHVVGSELAP